MPRFIDVTAASELMHCSEKTVRRYIRDGRIKAYRFGNLIRIDADELLGSLEVA